MGMKDSDYLELEDRKDRIIADLRAELERLKRDMAFQDEQYLREHENWGVCKWKKKAEAAEGALCRARVAYDMAIRITGVYMPVAVKAHVQEIGEALSSTAPCRHEAAMERAKGIIYKLIHTPGAEIVYHAEEAERFLEDPYAAPTKENANG